MDPTSPLLAALSLLHDPRTCEHKPRKAIAAEWCTKCGALSSDGLTWEHPSSSAAVSGGVEVFRRTLEERAAAGERARVDLVADPERDKFAELGIPIRAKRGDQWGAVDLAHLSTESAERWLRSDSTPTLAIRTLLLLLGHPREEIDRLTLPSRP